MGTKSIITTSSKLKEDNYVFVLYDSWPVDVLPSLYWTIKTLGYKKLVSELSKVKIATTVNDIDTIIKTDKIFRLNTDKTLSVNMTKYNFMYIVKRDHISVKRVDNSTSVFNFSAADLRWYEIKRTAIKAALNNINIDEKVYKKLKSYLSF